MDGGRGTVSFLVQGQQPNAAPSSFTGSRVPLTDVLFRVKAGVALDAPLITTMSVGSLLDPVYLGAVASNGDDISKAQSIAQVRSLARTLKWTEQACDDCPAPLLRQWAQRVNCTVLHRAKFVLFLADGARHTCS